MSQSLQQRIYDYVQSIFKKDQHAWLVWCDPHNEWGPLLERVASAEGGLKGFSLLPVNEFTAGEFASPLWRRRLQEHIQANEHFVLHVTTRENALGWLWAQALRAEEIYTKTLRGQLEAWGWRSQNIRTSNEELAQLAKQYLDRDPADWGGGGLQPDMMKLLSVLMGAVEKAEDEIVLQLTIDEAGLPDYDEQNLERWRTYTLAALLVTQAHSVAPDILSNHENLIAADKQKYALNLLDHLRDSVQLSKGLHERVIEADRVLLLGNYIKGVSAEHGPFLSYAAERALFAQTCSSLATKHGRELLETLALIGDVFEKHAHDFWGDKSTQVHSKALPWGELARLSRAVQQLLNAAPAKTWARPAEALNWYTATGWQVDRAGDELLRRVQRPTTEFLNLLTPLREAYRNHWEAYMLEWSDLWSKAGCPVPELPSQGTWLKEQLKNTQPTAVLVVDALRYDLGATLKERVNAYEGAERAHLVPARTALPTITALGMAMALPIKENELYADLVNGKWQLSQKGYPANLSIAENRREWLHTQLNVAPDALLHLSEAEKGNVPPPGNKHPRLFLFDALIDKLGHDEELEPQGTDTIQKRYENVINVLHNKGWKRILVVTDHGFIHWPGAVEHRIAPPILNPEPEYSSRRALAYPAQVELEGPQGLAPGKKWHLAFPHGAACFRTYGGLGYFHGGASLQEWIVPCLVIEWPSTAKPVGVSIQPSKQLLSLRAKIILEVKREGLFVSNEALSRQVELCIRNSRDQGILFTSKPKLITPDQEQVPVSVEPLEGVEAERGTQLIIELRDISTNEIIDTQTTVLMVPIENW